MVIGNKLFVPIFTLALLVVALPAQASHLTNDLNCSDFTYQQDAQEYLALHPGDPDNLDDDSDGVPCETLPDRPAASPTPSVSPTPSPVASTTPTPTPVVTSTLVAAQCHPAYAGVCIDPAASDVDCAGGGGDGPAYTTAINFQLVDIANDPYGLDRDHDGQGCDVEDTAAVAALAAPPIPAPGPTPLDGTKVKVLSRTGSESLPLLAFALGLLMLGSLCLSAARRQSEG